MSFGHPSQQGHKLAGFAKAAKSPKTPAHLRAHLQNLSRGGSVAKGKSFPINKQRRGPLAKAKPANPGMPLKNDSNAESTEPPIGKSTMFFGKARKQSKPKGPTSAFYGEM